MAKIKLSPLVTEITGKIGNIIFQNSKSGTIIKSVESRKKVYSNKQSKTIGLFNKVKQSWKNLSIQDKENWNKLSLIFSQNTKNKNSIITSGYQMFVKCNNYRLLVNDPILSTPSLEILKFVGVGFIFEFEEGGDLKMQIDFDEEENQVGIPVSISKIFPSTTKIQNSEIRFMNIYYQRNTFIDITMDYINLFGELPKMDGILKCKSAKMLIDSGCTSKPLISNQLVNKNSNKINNFYYAFLNQVGGTDKGTYINNQDSSGRIAYLTGKIVYTDFPFNEFFKDVTFGLIYELKMRMRTIQKDLYNTIQIWIMNDPNNPFLQVGITNQIENEFKVVNVANTSFPVSVINNGFIRIAMFAKSSTAPDNPNLGVEIDYYRFRK